MPVCAQGTSSQSAQAKNQEKTKTDLLTSENSAADGVIGSIEFLGLRRIPATTLRTKLSLKTGELVDAAKIARDVRVLEAMGWFDSVSVELEEMPVLLARMASAGPGNDDMSDVAVLSGSPLMKLIFSVEERPFLAKVDYHGGQLLTREKIREVFVARGVKLKLARPCDRTELWRAARAMEDALKEMGHPLAKVRVRLKEIPTAAMRATFVIEEGPRVEVEKVVFAGNEAFTDRVLGKQMKEIAPGALLAGWRGKTILSPERLEKDLERVRQFYRNHGYAEAQTGETLVEIMERRAQRWWPWPGKTRKQVIHVTIPVREGVAYRLDRSSVEGASASALQKVEPLLEPLKPAVIYSEEKILRVKEELARAEIAVRARLGQPKVEVEATSQLNRETQTIRVQFRVREAAPIVVRRIEFTGHRRFSDRYYRRRVLLKEGEEFDLQKLEQGLEQLAREGFVRPATRDDVKVKLD
ncbi:MAG TPA: POTRA domain-containing protein, partial [Candidatus Acidoferrales bacterium]|nr:POTRA domain-containing protein [Candidatus Acidoferrales bacterium]